MLFNTLKIIKKNYFFSLRYIKISEKTISFRDKKVNKKDFYSNKKQFNIDDIDINKILISKPEIYKKKIRKYIIGYNDNTISPLQLFLQKVTGYLNIFEMVIVKCLFLLLIMNF